MYFIKFNDIAIFAQESGKLTRMGIRYEIFDLDEETTFESLCKKYPYANSRKLDYFKSEKQNIIPGYVMKFIIGIDEIQRRITEYERDKKIDELFDK